MSVLGGMEDPASMEDPDIANSGPVNDATTA